MNKLIERLREYADWADANEYEIPLLLGDDLRAVIDLIENLQKGQRICHNRAVENYKLSNEQKDRNLGAYINAIAITYDASSKIIECILKGIDPTIYFK